MLMKSADALFSSVPAEVCRSDGWVTYAGSAEVLLSNEQQHSHPHAPPTLQLAVTGHRLTSGHAASMRTPLPSPMSQYSRSFLSPAPSMGDAVQAELQSGSFSDTASSTMLLLGASCSQDPASDRAVSAEGRDQPGAGASSSPFAVGATNQLQPYGSLRVAKGWDMTYYGVLPAGTSAMTDIDAWLQHFAWQDYEQA